MMHGSLALTPGTRIGVYEVLTPIGEGRMGQVFRARANTKLNRDVALKILPDAFASDPDRLARFTREAQTLASLNHPHIAHIHGLEESGGVRALVMELVEGEGVRPGRIGRKGGIAAGDRTALTHNACIRYKPNELAAIVLHKATLLVIVGQVPHTELARHFVNTLPRVVVFLDTHDPPLMGKVYRPPAERIGNIRRVSSVNGSPYRPPGAPSPPDRRQTARSRGRALARRV